MADDVVVSAGSYSATIAADDIGGVHHQRAKVVWGPNGTANDADVATGKPLPAQLRLSTGEEVGLPANAAAVAGEPGIVWLAVRKDSQQEAIADTDGKRAPLQVDANGLLRIAKANPLDSTVDSVSAALLAGTNNIGDVDVLTVPADPFGVNADAASATGSLSAKLRFIAATGIPITALPALVAGTAAIGKLAANSGVDIGDVDVTSISAGANLVGDVGLQGRTTGGLTKFKSLDLDETEEEVKATAGTLYGWFFYNAHASALRYLKVYDNTAAGTTVGTTVPDFTFPLKAGSSGWISVPQGIVCGTGITVAATTGFADNDTGAPGANEVFFNAWYK